MEPPPAIRHVSGGAAGLDLAEVVVTREQIARRVGELAGEIAAVMPGELTVLGVMDGALMFLADLVRRLPGRLHVQTIGVRSYRGAGPAPSVEILHPLPGNLAGRSVLIVDDILDTGRTLAAVAGGVAAGGPASFRTCVLLRKERPAGPPAIEADFVGFGIPDVFVVGYGLDFDGRFRALPDIVALKEGPEAVP